MRPSFEEFINENLKVLEEFFQQYQSYKDHIHSISTDKASASYEHRKNIVDAIDKLYPTLDGDYQKIIEMRHWNKYGQYTWKEVAKELHLSEYKVKRMNEILMYKFAKNLGWI